MKYIRLFLVSFLLIFLTSCATEMNSIESTEINDEGHLIITYTDGATEDLGLVIGENGQDGQDGLDGISGEDGQDGFNGNDGMDGLDGLDGADGENAPELYVVSFVIDTQFLVGFNLVEEGQLTGVPNTEMYEFLHIEGWYTNDAFTEEYTFDTAPSEDLVLYARWYELTYSVFDANGVEVARIDDYQGNVEELLIPSEIDGYPVQELGEHSFSETNLSSVVIPNSVTIIGDNAFKKSDSLESVRMTNSVIYLGEYSFRDCTMLEDIQISTSLRTITTGVFKNTPSLETIVLPPMLTDINDRAFEDSGLQTIDFPDSLISIGYYAFQGTHLASVTFPAIVNTVRPYSFAEIDELTTINIDSTNMYYLANLFSGSKNIEEVNVINTNPYLRSVDGVIYNSVLTYVMYYPPSKVGDVYNAPASIEQFYTGCFENNQYIEEINIHDTGLIDTSIFDDMMSIKDINIIPGDGFRYTSIDGVLFNYSEDTLLKYPINKPGSVYTVPSSVLTISGRAFMNNENVLSLILPAGLLEIDAYAFYNADGLLSVNIPSTVVTIGVFAFYDCDGLLDLDVNGTMTVVEDFAFAEMDSLQSISLPDTVEAINGYAFLNSTSLLEFTIGENVEVLSIDVFRGCSSLESILVDGSNVHFFSEDGVVIGYDWQLYVYPEGKKDPVYEIHFLVTSIGAHVFMNNVYLEEVVVPANVTLADKTPFYNLPNLHSIHVEELNLLFFTNSIYKLYGDCPNLKFYVTPQYLHHYLDATWDAYRYDILPEENIS